MEEEKDLLLNPQVLRSLGKQLGYSNSIPPQFIELASTLLLGSMAKKANTEQGTDELVKDMEENDGGILDQIEKGRTELFGRKKEGLLDNLLGNKIDPLAEAFSKATGLPKAKAKQLMVMLAPVILAMVAQKVSDARATGDKGKVAKGVKDLYKKPPKSKEEFQIARERLRLEQEKVELEQRRKQLEQKQKELEQRHQASKKNKGGWPNKKTRTPNKEDGGLLEKILDRDGDGSFMDEAASILKSLLLK